MGKTSTNNRQQKESRMNREVPGKEEGGGEEPFLRGSTTQITDVVWKQ